MFKVSRKIGFVVSLVGASLLSCGVTAACQSPETSPTISSSTTVVLVPALVTNKASEPVFTLTAADFTVTDDGIPQKLHLEQDSDSEPLALVVALQTGGAGARQIDKYRQLAALIEALPGSVPHRIAIVTFGSTPKLVQDFVSESPNQSANDAANGQPGAQSAMQPIDDALKNLSPGDDGAAILDTLGYAVDLLRDQPPKYRRAILLFSETHDDTVRDTKGHEKANGSHLTLDQALRDISDTNTTIYSFAFSDAGAEARHKSAKAFGDRTPGPRHGCMGQDAAPAQGVDDGDDSETGSGQARPKRSAGATANQAYDCAGLLLPPLALAKVAVEAATSGLRRDVPETVADLTGGEYYSFKNAKAVQQDLVTIANHVPNRYVLSFQPQSPHAGLHALSVRLKAYPHLEIDARTSYWADEETAATTEPATK